MWLIIMLDLPTTDSEARADYRHFHDFLLNEGYLRLQLSVYGRHCASEENGAVHMQRLRAALPPDGEVRMLTLTDKQFSRMQVFFGRMRQRTEPPPEQILLL